jgi:glycosyltransferase involved in cell wall biosynthesis
MIKVSIITVCLNASKTVESTILSVLSQDYPNIQFIIIDGLSSDNTMAVVQAYTDQISIIVSEKDNGLYDAINKGVLDIRDLLFFAAVIAAWLLASAIVIEIKKAN